MAASFPPSSGLPVAKRGLFVGIEHYPSPSIEDLEFCGDDALRQCLAFGLDPESCLLTDEQATRVNILQRLMVLIDEIQPEELLIFSITGHGVIAFQDYFFTPYEADAANVLGTCISSALSLKVIASVAHRGAKVLLILDTCHAGAIGFDLSRYKGGVSCLFSCSPMELSAEAYVKTRTGTGHFNSRGGNGLFTHFLARGLEEKPPGFDPDITTLRGLYQYVYQEVSATSKGMQHPQLIGTLEGSLRLI